MGLKSFRPTSPGLRHKIISDFAEITADKPEKSLTRGKKSTAGRNAYGRITVRHRGSGNKNKYRIIDFKRDKAGVPATVFSIEYDPNRSARIALLHYVDGEKRYILAPQGLNVGDTVSSGVDVDIKPGNALPLSKIPVGVFIHNVEFVPGQGGKIARSAGNSVQLMARESGYALLKMPSGELRRVRETCMATIGVVGNEQHMNESYGKAGRSRWLGIRPAVRGMTMNAVDHPMGGGEGKTKGGNVPQSPWGTPAKGYKTRRGKKRSDRLIVRRRNSGKAS